jgi:hypothetical protein
MPFRAEVGGGGVGAELAVERESGSVRGAQNLMVLLEAGLPEKIN